MWERERELYAVNEVPLSFMCNVICRHFCGFDSPPHIEMALEERIYYPQHLYIMSTSIKIMCR
jgi:hypothetical protein